MGNQSFIVDEPAAVPYPCGLAFICEILRHSHAIGLDKFLIVPEPEGLHTQKTATDFKQTVYKAEGIGGGQHQSVLMHLQAETLRRKVTILARTISPPGIPVSVNTAFLSLCKAEMAYCTGFGGSVATI